MADSRPIGMLDSGIGGLSVLRYVRELLPAESVIYVADEGHLPYGPRQRDEIRVFVEGIARYLIDQRCKLIVIACNTANAAALHHLRSVLPDFPIVGMEPAVKPAAEHTKTGVIGVIMTKATYQSELYASVVDRFAQQVRVESRACPDLVTLAEQAAPHSAETRRIIAECLGTLKATPMDQLVLGCTHFPFLIDQIQDYLGSGVTIIDPAPAVARQVKRVLEQLDLMNDEGALSTVRYLTSGDAQHFDHLLSALTGETGAEIETLHRATENHNLALT